MDRRGFFRSLVAGVGAAVAVVATAPLALARETAPTPYGIDYWVVKKNARPRWRNYAAKYTPIARHDLLAKFRKAGVVFQPPAGV